MKSMVINFKADYEKALKRIEEIFDAQPGDQEFQELQELVKITELYEEEHYPIEKPEPIDMLRFRMEQESY